MCSTNNAVEGDSHVSTMKNGKTQQGGSNEKNRNMAWHNREDGRNIGRHYHGSGKTRIVTRSPEDERWNSKLTPSICGVPWESVPGKPGQHIPVEISADGQTMDEVKENLLPKTEDANEDKQEP